MTPPRVLIAPDKFKGSLTAAEVAAALSRGLADAGVETVELPLADGGDGTVDAVIAAGFTPHRVTVPDALGRVHEAAIGYDGHTAVVEVANTCGLALLGGERTGTTTGDDAADAYASVAAHDSVDLRDRAAADGGRQRLDAMAASSTGLGEAVAAALDLRPRPTRLVIGLGGSASTDGGMGMLRALGARFLDDQGRELSGRGADLHAVASVDLSGLTDLSDVEILCATDVDSPLTGPLGAAHVFGEQKGADAQQRAELDAGLDRLVEVIDAATDGAASAWSTTPGAGAAGGLGFGCLLLGARQVSGADLLLDLLAFDEVVVGVDAVVTGEGRLDEQTLAGKLPAVVARRSGDHPVHAVVGASALTQGQWAGVFASVSEVASHPEAAGRDTRTDVELTREILLQIGTQLASR